MSYKIADLQTCAKRMADDNRYVYGRWNGAGNNTTSNPSDGYHWDCCTALSRVIRNTMSGNYDDNTPISWYCWPNNDGDPNFDNYLLCNGFEKHKYNYSEAIKSGYEFIPVIGTEHVWAFYSASQDLQFEMNTWCGADIHTTQHYSDAEFMYYPVGWAKGGEVETGGFEVSKLYDVKKPGTDCEGLTRTIQSILNEKNNAGLVVDGIYGDLTEAAVMDWQSKYPSCGNVDGWVGELTWFDLLTRNV